MYIMGKILSKLCACLGRDIEVDEEVARREYTEYRECNFDSLNYEELQTPLKYCTMNHRRGFR